MKREETLPVALLFGGAGCEHEVSCRSATYAADILQKSGVSLLPVGIGRDGAWRLCQNTAAVPGDAPPTFPVRLGEQSGFLSGGRVMPVRCALPILHGDRGEDGEIQGALGAAGIPFAGCDVFAGAVGCDKIATKILAASAGIAVVPFVHTDLSDPEQAADLAESSLDYPMFVKPARCGSSLGAAPAKDRAALMRAYPEARRYGRVLIERRIDLVCEPEVAYLDGVGFSSPGRVRTTAGATYYSFEEKYGKNSHSVADLGEDLPEDLSARCKSAAAKIVDLLGVRDLARVDFFLDRRGVLYFNEINTLPGMTGISLYPRLVARMGVSPERLFARLLSLAEERKRQDGDRGI